MPPDCVVPSKSMVVLSLTSVAFPLKVAISPEALPGTVSEPQFVLVFHFSSVSPSHVALCDQADWAKAMDNRSAAKIRASAKEVKYLMMTSVSALILARNHLRTVFREDKGPQRPLVSNEMKIFY